MAEIDEVGPSAGPQRRMEALKLANEVRRQRAEIKQALRSGGVSVAGLLLDPPESLLTARLSEILFAVPGYGEVRVGRLLRRCRISRLKTVGALSERQRIELVRSLAGV